MKRKNRKQIAFMDTFFKKYRGNVQAHSLLSIYTLSKNLHVQTLYFNVELSNKKNFHQRIFPKEWHR